MAISKKLKRQIKGTYKGSDSTGSRKQTWSLKVGDLVEFMNDENEWRRGVVVDDNRDGYYLIMSPAGRRWHKAKKLRCLEKAAHANDSQSKV